MEVAVARLAFVGKGPLDHVTLHRYIFRIFIVSLLKERYLAY